MHEPTYRQALERAWELIRKHKTVWVFGILSLLVGQLGWNNFIGGLAIFPGQKVSLSAYLLNFPWSTLFVGGNWLWSIWLFLVLMTLLGAVIFLSVASEGALVAAGCAWFRGGHDLMFEQAWKKGVRHFPRLLVLHVLKKGILIALLLFTNFLIGKTIDNPGALALVLTLAITLALCVVTIGIFSSAYVVDREMPVAESITRGAELFHHHLLVSLELSLILFGLQLAVIMTFLLASVWFLVPFVSIIVVAGFTGKVGLVLFGMYISLILALIAAAIVGGILNAFTISSWMYLFKKMDHEGVKSRIVHWLFSHN